MAGKDMAGKDMAGKMGFVYIVSNNVGGINGIDYIREALFSAISLRRFHSVTDYGISIITKQNNLKHLNNITENVGRDLSMRFGLNGKDNIWDNIIIVDDADMSLRCKQHLLYSKTPYQKTVFIDSDTFINWKLDDLFSMLDNFDVLGAHDYSRKRYFDFFPEYNLIPYGFSEINTGLIAFRKNELVSNFFNEWDSLYNKYRVLGNLQWDQPSFRVSIWKAIGLGLRFYCLPVEYNRRSKDTKKKCIDLKNKGDSRFGKEHLRTRVYHFHGIEKMFRNGGNKWGNIVENTAQNF